MSNHNFSYDYRIHCLAQHFSVWFEDIKRDRVPDFVLPCQRCKNQEVCHKLGYPWLEILEPILQGHGITLSLAQRGYIQNERTH